MRNKRDNNYAFTSIILSTKFMSCFPSSPITPLEFNPCTVPHWRTSIRPLNFVHQPLWDICATFQASSGYSERGFRGTFSLGLMSAVKSKSRNWLQTDHLDMLMRVKFHRSSGAQIYLDNWQNLFPQVIAEGLTWMPKRWTFRVKVRTIILFACRIWHVSLQF